MLTAANTHDSMVFEELVDAIEPIKRPRGRPRMVGPESARRSSARRQSLLLLLRRRQKVQAGSEEARHQEPHSSQEGDREHREVGRTQVGARVDTSVACEVP
jgi:hypothetical protein